MKKNRQTCFRNEIRRILIVHTLVPCIISLLIVILLVMMISIYKIREKNGAACQKTADAITSLADCYTTELEEKQNLLAEYLADEQKNQSELAADVYAFLNGQDVRGDFYLFDAEKNLVFSTQINDSVRRDVRNYISWGARQKDGTIHFVYENSLTEGQAEPMWFLMSSLTDHENVVGYCAFTLAAEKFQKLSLQENPTVLIVNEFYRIFAGSMNRFSDERGKLTSDFRDGDGFIHADERWYYGTGQWILDGEMKICTFYDCTFLIQLSSISMAVVLILGSIIVVMVYISAGRVADKKTEILSDVVKALEQVEKGNFNVSMKISSGDEFEKIGKSFNMMLGSIRHLLERHETLAQENMLANMQILESQFNPHFLFNTLESIRYMIHFDSDEAEKMLVGLSKLLRYSIKTANDEVCLEEEMEFVDRYLQIMLYRYGKRLKFYTDWEEACWDYKVPRMILQPIVENAIKYGYSDETEILEIWIRAYLDETTLRIQVEDNGQGIPNALLEELTENLKRNVNRSDHIGLYNVNKRIKLMYGGNYGIQIKSTAGSGTTVEISMPMKNLSGSEDE